MDARKSFEAEKNKNIDVFWGGGGFNVQKKCLWSWKNNNNICSSSATWRIGGGIVQNGADKVELGKAHRQPETGTDLADDDGEAQPNIEGHKHLWGGEHRKSINQDAENMKKLECPY